MSVRIGINPLTWTNDDMPELGGDTPLEVCLTEARIAGFEGVELGNKFPRISELLSIILSTHQLSLASGWYSSKLLWRAVQEEIANVEGHLQLLRNLGCKAMVFADTSGAIHGERRTPLSTRMKLDDTQWDRLTTLLTRVGDHLAGEGVRLAYHHHMGTTIQTEEEIDRLMASTGPSVGLLLDTGHLTFAGGDPVRVIEKHGSRILHVHLKDVRRPVLEKAVAEDWSFLKSVLEGVFTVPGDGSVDYPAVFQALAKANYQGWLVVEAEQDPAKAHPLTYARMGHANVLQYCKDVGWR
jgi:inosose dehydratase